jgi:signal transduction histidine kinase/ActR/RegA family two-component response regulator
MKHESNKKSVLVADDNTNIVRVIQVSLELEGYQTILAFDGEEALEKAISQHPDLIILDLLMPKKHGWQVLEHLKKDPVTSNIPVIVLTAMGQKEDQRKGWELGVNDYITKPFNPMRLLEVVNRTLKPRSRIVPFIPLESVPVTRVAIVGGGEKGAAILQTLLGNSRIQILGVADVKNVDSILTLARELKIPVFQDPYDLCRIPDVDLLIETGTVPLNTDRVKEISPDLEIVKGYVAEFMWGMLEEKEASEERARSLVKELHTKIKELNALYEAGKAMGSVMDLQAILSSVLTWMGDQINAESGLIFMSDDDAFTPRAARGNPAFFIASRSTLELAFKTGKPVLVSGIACDIPSAYVALVPIVSKEKKLGFASFLFSQKIEASEGDITFLATLAAQAAIAIENAKLYEDMAQSKKQIEALLSKVIDAQEEERKRISAELHDSIAQSLVSMHTEIQTCQALLSRSQEKGMLQLEGLKKRISESIQEVRQIIFNLRPSTLDDLGLITTLEHYFKKFEAENQIFVSFQNSLEKLKLSPALETALYRIVQEALTNIKKHSHASRAEIELKGGSGKIYLQIFDNGNGLPDRHSDRTDSKGYSLGITGMQERAALLGGTFKMEAVAGGGTRIQVEIPD